MKKRKINVGIIGNGVVGKRRAKFIKQNENYSLKYISDISFKKDSQKNELYLFKNYNKIISLKPDAVFVTLPNYLAAKVTKKLLINGIHVFCEKPPGKNLSDIKSVRKVEKNKKNLKLKYGFNHRYHGSVKLAKKILNKGTYGKILNIRAVYGKSKIVSFEKNEWRSKKKFSGGGILLDQGIHLLDLISYLHGEFVEFKSFISNKYWKYDVEDNAFALMRDKKGIVASIHSTATQWQHKFNIEITLEKCLMTLSGILSGTKTYGEEKLVITLNNKNINKKPKIKIFKFKTDNSWRDEVDEFANIILKNKKIETGNSNQALEVMTMIDKIYKNDKKWKN
mgnify:CR=1 FL=1|tara:strand:- start:92 stop:1105 length:1014 start_codon:yes stop_codon:yes gene_type:complete